MVSISDIYLLARFLQCPRMSYLAIHFCTSLSILTVTLLPVAAIPCSSGGFCRNRFPIEFSFKAHQTDGALRCSDDPIFLFLIFPHRFFLYHSNVYGCRHVNNSSDASRRFFGYPVAPFQWSLRKRFMREQKEERD